MGVARSGVATIRRAMPFDITLISIARALFEVCGMMLVARGVLWIFGPKARQGNFFYDLLTVGAKPFMNITRRITPRVVRDAYIPVMTFVLVFVIWIGLGIAKAAMCASRGLQCM